MAEVSDEMLMAYADDELDAAARSDLEAVLAGRPDLVARVKMFERTRIGVQPPFDDILNEPVPAELIAGIRSAPIGGSNVEPLRPRPSVSPASSGMSSQPSVWRYTAIAASIGLLVGCASGWYAGASTKPSPSAGAPVADAGIRALGSVRTALETGSSGVATVIKSGEADERITPVATFRSKDQRFCRHYVIDSGSKNEGVACRSASGAWDILYHGRVVPKGTIDSRPLAPCRVRYRHRRHHGRRRFQ